ncbi:MAG: hypothetical protein Q4P13_11575 [Psychrobacter sp.]|nr:hypothetical protein [Psychrobacter sp.]
MDRSLNNPSLSNRKIRQLSYRRDPANYDEFLNQLYHDLDCTIDRLSQSKDKYYQGLIDNSKRGEDLINLYICDMLDARGWVANHSKYVNGNADIVVSADYSEYQWLGEGKIRSGNSNLDKGMKQLLHRYSTGRDFQTSGGLVIYLKDTQKTAKNILEDWKKYLLNPNLNTTDEHDLPTILPPALKVEQCAEKQLIFYSYHKHPSSGLDYKVRHMIIDFRCNPLE